MELRRKVALLTDAAHCPGRNHAREPATGITTVDVIPHRPCTLSGSVDASDSNGRRFADSRSARRPKAFGSQRNRMRTHA